MSRNLRSKVVSVGLLALAVICSVRAVQAQSITLFSSDGSSLGHFSCEWSPETLSVSGTQGNPAPSVHVASAYWGGMLSASYLPPVLGPGDVLHGALDFNFEPGAGLEIADFGASVTSACAYDPTVWPLPQINYGYLGPNTLSHYPTDETGHVIRKDVTYPLDAGVWHRAELFFQASAGGGYDYRLVIDGLLVLSDHTWATLDPTREVAVYIGDGSSGQESRVWYDNIKVELVPGACLVGHYRFDGTTLDESGFGNHGTVHGAVQFVPGEADQDQAVYFDNPSGDVRVTQWIEFPSFSWLSGESFTIAIRYKTADATQQGGDLFGAYASDLYTSGVNLQYNDQTHPRAYTRVGDGTRYYWNGYHSNSSPDGITTDGTYHWQVLVLDRSLGELNMYVDDHLIETTTVSDLGVPIGSLGSVLLDRVFLGASTPLGRYGARLTTVDELRIYGCPLSHSEVLDLVTPCGTPVIDAAAASPGTLWPPNHKMVPVSIDVAASGGCGGQPVCRVVGIASNEPSTGLGSGNQRPDWEILGDLRVALRAERGGSGRGRIYTVSVECIDSAAKSVAASVKVTVPHNQ